MQLPKADQINAASLFVASVIKIDPPAALIVAQPAATEQELASCSEDGPQGKPTSACKRRRL